ncbi:MAG: Carbonic anhydrase 2 [Chlamydiia bacterium]|nr:Carbonic anhydrase 2 [Chlamydiia bacterium]MCH9615925.1 Carbonic anhydrase 2 [Chlamydiia bacterium]MCH9628672.1 Carbonic anhydrase 2 [Chlamydiia bacterium]
MKKLKKLFDNNKAWVLKKTGVDPKYFSKLAKQQTPLYLWFGCSDSRVPANEIVALEPGELFVHRNIANLCPHTDLNSLSVLEYSVNCLNIEHIIVCGHYGCGGVKAAMENNHLGLVDNWLRNVRDVYDHNKAELENISNEIERYNRLVELNVCAQVKNICHTTIVQNAWEKKQPLCVHGWVYDLETGQLKDLSCTISSAEEINEAYKVHS